MKIKVGPSLPLFTFFTSSLSLSFRLSVAAWPWTSEEVGGSDRPEVAADFSLSSSAKKGGKERSQST